MDNKTKTAIVGGTAIAVATATYLLVQPPAPSKYLVWDRMPDHTNVVYEVWHMTNISGKLTPVNTNWTATNYPFFPTNKMEFFAVRARNTNNGLVSGWATTKK